MALKRNGAIRPLRPGEFEAAALAVRRRDAMKGPSPGPFRTEEELFDHILAKINYDPAASVDFGDHAKLGRFYEYWSKKELAGEAWP